MIDEYISETTFTKTLVSVHCFAGTSKRFQPSRLELLGRQINRHYGKCDGGNRRRRKKSDSYSSAASAPAQWQAAKAADTLQTAGDVSGCWSHCHRPVPGGDGDDRLGPTEVPVWTVPEFDVGVRRKTGQRPVSSVPRRGRQQLPARRSQLVDLHFRLFICPIAIAYSMGQMIKSVCVCQSVGVSVCPFASTLTVAFLDQF